MQQLDFFADLDRPVPAPPGPPADVRETVRQILVAVLQFFLRRGEQGATDCELCQALGRNRDSVRPRRCELRDAGLVVDSGRKRPTKSGKLAIVWRVRPGATMADLDQADARRSKKKSTPSALPAEKPPSTNAVPVDGGPIRCDRCGSRSFVDVRIHNGQSTRRDCARCGRTNSFPNWYGKLTEGN